MDSRLELELRFKVLEVIELKSSGWISNDISDNVDKKKLKDLSIQSEIKENGASPQNVKSDKNKRMSLFSRKVNVDGVEIIVDEKQLEESSIQSEIKENAASPQNVESDRNKRMSLFSSKVNVGGVEIIVKSKSKVMMENSKKALRGYFSLGNPGNRVFKYSKEQLLSLSSAGGDDNWTNVVKFIPKNLVRAEYLSPVS